MLSGSHTVSRDWGQQHRLSEEQNWNEGVTQAPEKARGEQEESEGTGENRSPREAGAHRITEGFHFLPFVPLFLTSFYTEDIFGDVQVFRYSDNI